MKPFQLVAVGFIAVMAGVFFFGSQPSVSTKDTIHIGAVLSLTGDAAAYGLDYKRGIELAVADLAHRGVTVRVSYEDDATDPKQTVSALKYLIATDRPQAVIGATWSFLEDSIAPVVAEEKIVLFSPANTSEFVSVLSPYQFHGAPRNALRKEPVAQWLKENNKKRVAIVLVQTKWGESNAQPLRDAAQEAGATVVVDERFQGFDSNVGSSIATIMAKVRAANADVIVWAGHDSDAVALLQYRQSLELDVPILAGTVVYGSLLSRGVVSEQQLHDVYYIDVPASPSFLSQFADVYGGEQPVNFTDRAYDGTMMLVEAIQNTNGGDADAIAAYLRADVQYTREGQTFEFNNNGDLLGDKWTISPVLK